MKIGDSLLCKKNLRNFLPDVPGDPLYLFIENKEYKVLSNKDSENLYYVESEKIQNVNFGLWLSDFDIPFFFYDIKELRKRKIKKIQNS